MIPKRTANGPGRRLREKKLTLCVISVDSGSGQRHKGANVIIIVWEKSTEILVSSTWNHIACYGQASVNGLYKVFKLGNIHKLHNIHR
jgi:hypothetical protein